MTAKADHRREKLRLRLMDIAETTIAADGLSAIKARVLAHKAECSVGAIYNVFDDLQELVIAVNGRTFRKLGHAVAASLTGLDSAPPTERLIAMSYAYMGFAADNPLLWRALFNLRMSVDMDVPEWYMHEMDRLFGYIAGPVQDCFPDQSPSDVALMTRALFSSVHGIVLLGLENRISAVPRPHLKRMIALLLQKATGNR